MLELVLLVLAFTCVCAEANGVAALFLLGALGVVARKRSNLAERLNDLRDEFTQKMDSLQDELSDLRRLVRQLEAQPEPTSAVIPSPR